MKKLIVDEKSWEMRLDKYLLQHLAVSRSQIQKKIKAGEVLINAKKPTVHQFLKIGDVIEFIKIKIEPKIMNTKNVRQNKAQTKTVYNIEIIENNPDYLIINKPAGLVVHPSAKTIKNPSVLDWLSKNYPEVKKIKDPKNKKNDRPGIVHRLDKEVSGLLILAKKQASFDYFKNLFKDRHIQKEYIALVHGKFENLQGEINFRISRKIGEGKMAAHPTTSKMGKESLTRYTVLQKFAHATLLQIQILTGRTHQIRVHFQALNHPIVGDKLYGHETFANSSIKTPQIMLFAHNLKFVDQDSQEKNFELPYPPFFQEILNSIQNKKIKHYVK
ncbi:MAG: RluA family pseudouridine synthase [Patescibacteria group bacterium]